MNKLLVVLYLLIICNLNTIFSGERIYRTYTKGSFDCVHLGHFLLFAEIKYMVKERLNCNYSNIELHALLSTQDGSKHKYTKYLQSEDQRKRLVQSTELVDIVEFCEETVDFVKSNTDKIDVFAFGNDQIKTSYFKKIQDLLIQNDILYVVIPERDKSLSSTMVKSLMTSQNINYLMARRAMENKYILTDFEQKAILDLLKYSIISGETLKKFNINIK